MASLIGHAIIATAIARAVRLDRRGTAAAVVLSVLPDADVLISFAGKGNGEAWHRAAWSHSVLAAIAAGMAATGSGLVFQAGRNGRLTYMGGLRTGILTSAFVGSHLILDYWLMNPLERAHPRFRKLHELSNVVRYHILNLPTDIAFYGAIGFGFYKLWRWFIR